MGTLRKVEREVLRRKYGNKALHKAYRDNRALRDRNYIVHKKLLTCKGEKIFNIIIVFLVLMVLVFIARG